MMRILALRLLSTFVVVGMLTMPGCGKKPETSTNQPPPATGMPTMLHVMSVSLGRTIDSGNRVMNATEQFSPGETIYASIETQGSAVNATLTARWTYEGGQLVDESSHAIAPTGPAVTEFHISKPGGWPAGKYKLEVTLNGMPAGMKEFTVSS